METFINELLNTFSTRLTVYLDNWTMFLLICLSAIVLITPICVLEFVYSKKRKSSSYVQQLLKLIGVIQTYLIILSCLFVGELITKSNIIGNFLFVDTAILTTVFLTVYKLIDRVIVTIIWSIVKLIKITKQKRVNKKVVITKSAQDVEIESVCAAFTRQWLDAKLKEEPSETRVKLLEKYKKDYINNLVDSLPNYCNKHKEALYSYTHYLSIWK